MSTREQLIENTSMDNETNLLKGKEVKDRTKNKPKKKKSFQRMSKGGSRDFHQILHTPLIICFASYSMLKNILLGFPILNSFICGSHAMRPLVLFKIITKHA
jgi:hypothetical protein